MNWILGDHLGSVSLVTPGLATVVDARLQDFPAVYGGCGVAGYTLRIRPADLIAVTGAQVFDITEPRS